MLTRRRLRALLLASILVPVLTAGCGTTSSSDADGGWRLSWSDEFDGDADGLPSAASWSFQTGGDGWGNAELECYTDAPGNASTDGDGHLVITALRQPGHRCVDGRTNDWTSARISTQDKVTAEHGRLEVRARVPSGVGTWAAFWALGEDHDWVGWPASGELDVMEQVGAAPRQVLGTAHGPREDGSHWYLTGRDEAEEPLSARFHTYGMTWSPTRLTWTLDGRTYASLDKDRVEQQGGRWVYDKPFYLLLNLAIGGNLGGSVPANTASRQEYVVDWVRVYRRDR